MKKEQLKSRGITLIALVITIIVLLILAGVTIAALSGPNGILTNATKAKEETEKAEIEEQGNLIYTELLADNITGNGDEPTLDDVVNKLVEKGYEIIKVATSGGSVTGITISPNTLTLAPGEEGEIGVTLEGSSDGYSYYAVINGNKYLMTLESNGIKIADEKSEVEETGSEITAESNNGDVTVKVENNKVKVTAGSSATGTATITIKYGTFSKTCNVSIAIKPTDSSVADSSVTFSKAYGTIDVIWLDTENNIIENPEEPRTTSEMTKVTWTKSGDTWQEDATAQTEWYKYIGKDETGDNTESKWANVKIDESYFVWIPRYAYRITYYANKGDTTPTGYSDGWGIWRASDGKLENKITEETGIETVEYNGNKYIVHPAFCNGTNTEFKNGEWDTDLAGIWVAKYEASQVDSTTTPKFEPGVSSWRSIKIGNMYTNAQNYKTGLNSHLMKNSEWGAVAYLTHSKYGRNGEEIEINNNGSTYYTGGGTGTTYLTKGTQSTTGNPYGIYDLSGNAYEYVAGYYKNGNFSYANSTFTTGVSDQYSTVYAGTNDSSAFIYGDATYETRGWFSDFDRFVDSNSPFFLRGGDYDFASNAGVFNFSSYDGDGNSYRGFRMCLAVQ